MMPEFNAWSEIAHWTLRLSLVAGSMAWWRKGSIEEDITIANAAHELLEGLADADKVGKIEENTNINLRDQVSIEKAEDWAKDRDLRSFTRRN